MRVCPECDTRTEELNCPADGRPTIEESRLKIRGTDPLIDTIVDGKYRVMERLGRGAFGSVYRGVHLETGGAVALKLLHRSLADDESVIRRFYIEAQNTHRLHHHNTVRVSDFGQTAEGVLFLAMEFVSGQTLHALLKTEGRIAPARAVRIAEQILRSLGEAHANSVVHRDVKPQNIMLVDRLGEPDFVKVLDFGVSRSLDSTGASTRGSIGTPRYMAPEQWAGGRADPRADLYSLGCILYQMLAGRTPFVVSGRGGEPALAYMMAHTTEIPTGLLEIAPAACPAPLAELVMRLLEKDVAKRPSTALDVLKELSQIKLANPLAEHVTGGGRPYDVPPPLPMPEADGTSLDGDERSVVVAPASSGASVWKAVLAAVVLGLVVVVGAYAWRTQSRGEVVTSPPSAVAPAAPSSPAVAAAASPDLVRLDAEPEVAKPRATLAAPPVPAALPAAPAVEAPAPPGRISVDSRPTGALVRAADGTELGKTPLELTRETVGEAAKVSLELADHRGRTVELAFPAAGAHSTMAIALVQRPTVRLVSVPPGANIRSGELFLGKTPSDVRLTEAQLVALEGGTEVTFALELEGRRETVSLQAIPAADAVAPTLAVSFPARPSKPTPRKPPRPARGKPGWRF